MLTKVLGVDIQAIFMTMLALVGFYLVLTRADDLNKLVTSATSFGIESLVVLQGRDPTKVLRR